MNATYPQATTRNQPALLFDLDGTLVDSVYQHVLAWREALAALGINLSVWKIHRRIGMSGGLFVTALARELETNLDQDTLARLPSLHADAYVRHFDSVSPLPGAVELLATLSEHGVPWAIATSGVERYARLAEQGAQSQGTFRLEQADLFQSIATQKIPPAAGPSPSSQRGGGDAR